ncbi:MAG: hypothetical protein ACXW4Z_19005 [Candidatus Binatia bacterium]
MTRAKNLSAADIETIVKILDGWSGKLTWDLLIKAIARRSKAIYTRQALNNHERIKSAFALRKSAVTGKPGSIDKRVGSSPEFEAALERISRLEGENQRLQMENNRFMEKFATWAYNAHVRGLDEAFLSQPLPTIDRSITR